MISKTEIIGTIGLVLISMFFFACKENVAIEPNPVVFEISQPKAGSIYGYGDTVYIDSYVSWENELHGYEVFIKQMNNDSIVFSSHAHNDTHQMNIYKIWVNQVKEYCDMQLIIRAYTSHEEEWQTTSLNFTCLPKK